MAIRSREDFGYQPRELLPNEGLQSSTKQWKHLTRRRGRIFDMQVGYFTERPYRWLPEEEILKNRAFFAISNKFFDREKAADDYHYYLL
jgi:hypothetical protein